MQPNVKGQKVTFRAFILMAQEFISRENPQNAEEFIRKAIVIHNLINQSGEDDESYYFDKQNRQDKLLAIKKLLRELKGEPEPEEET